MSQKRKEEDARRRAVSRAISPNHKKRLTPSDEKLTAFDVEFHNFRIAPIRKVQS